jgi:hypothetical protein
MRSFDQRRPASCRPPQLELLEERCLLSAYGQLPLTFEINQGQARPDVDFLSHGAGYGLSLSAGGAVLGLSKGTGTAGQAATSNVVAMSLVGASAAPLAKGLEPLATTSNYLIGNDPARWHTNIANYGQVEYQNVYPGISLVYYGNQRNLEYDFQVAPGANPGVIQLAFSGAEALSLDGQGNLVLATSGGTLTEHAPVVYQQQGAERQPVAGRYVLEGGNQVGFAVGAYDARRPLIVDPILSYSTYFGGSGDDGGTKIAVDAAGNAYFTGSTTSSDLPRVNPSQPASGGGTDAFVAKLNASGTALVYATYLGGNGTDVALGIAVDAAGNAYLTGHTDSSNFPTANPLQPTYGGGTDAFVAKLNASGTALVYSTYLGGSDFDNGTGLAVDASGSTYVVGNTLSTNFPTVNPGQQALDGLIDAFVAKLNGPGTALVYATYFGGSGPDYGLSIAVDAAGDACFAGETFSPDFPVLNALLPVYGGNGDAFVAKLNPSASALIYSTYLGSSALDYALAVALDPAGDAYVTGQTNGSFPLANPLQSAPGGSGDAFVTELSTSGTTLVYSTYLGGNDVDAGSSIAVDASGSAYVTGWTQSSNFPTANTPESSDAGGRDGFVTKVGAAGTGLVYSTYLGGAGVDTGVGIAVDASGNAYITGVTQSSNFPMSAPLQLTLAGPSDAFVAKIATAPLSGLGTTLTPVAAAPFTGTVASLVANAPGLSGFTALVSWGDNSTSTATLVPFSGGYRVLASHTYASAGLYPVLVTIQDSNGDSATALSQARVAPAPVTGIGKTASFTEAAAVSQVVAAFQVADPSAFPGRFTALIQWGDGTPATPGTISADGAGFAVSGTHAYATHGSYPLTVTITDAAGGSATVNSTAQVDYPALIGAPRYISVIGALQFSGVVATFTDPDVTRNAHRYRAVITWPDTHTTATVTPTLDPLTGPTDGGHYTVTAGHTFHAFTGTLTLLVVVTDLQDPLPGGGNRSVTIQSRVSDPPAGVLNQAYVTQLYRDLLQRAPDAASLASWSGLLDQGASAQQVAQAILASLEYQALEVRQLYTTYLHRAPDALGLASFTHFLSAGGTVEQAAALLVASPEYARTRSAESDAGFVTALYQDALGRAPDPAGAAAFGQALAQGLSRAQATALLFGSAEYQQDLVQSAFQRYLHRQPDPLGLGSFTGALARGLTDTEMLVALCGSAEYFADAQDQSAP